MEPSPPDIIYTIVDEAPALASESLLPIIKAFAGAAGVAVGTKDISLAARILAAFPEYLSQEHRQSDDLAALGRLVQTAQANVIKLPNISASMPQLVDAIGELQSQGYGVPDYPQEPQTDSEKTIRARYDAIKGSAVNPVLREGNSDRRAARAVKAHARRNPHPMGEWHATSQTRVSSMAGGDFYGNEKSATLTEAQAGPARIEFVAKGAAPSVLKEGWRLESGAVVDATFMAARVLSAFLAEQIAASKGDGTLFSLHVKATMMKVSDPVIFGHGVRAWLAPVFEAHGAALAAAGVNPNLGLGDVLARVAQMPKGAALQAEIADLMAHRPAVYMVDSNRGITNLHVPSDVIIDASMPAIIRAGGKGWDASGAQRDVNCVIPDRCYAPVYDETICFFKAHGALNPATAGSVANVGLMAQKAEEYGSHPTTFVAPKAGLIRIVLANGEVLHSHAVEEGDIWRACATGRAAIANWIALAQERQRLTGSQAIFWLDSQRAHDQQLIAYVRAALDSSALAGSFAILDPRQATRRTLETITAGRDSIAITGNVLRDYLTDLFPILELGTSAKMLSIVQLMHGGGLFETGAGGSAPRHVQQLLQENHLRWDSMGEFCALGESLNFLAHRRDNRQVAVLAAAVERATQTMLEQGRAPGRKVGQPDNRDSHYWFACYWAQALAAQGDDPRLAAHFAPLAAQLVAKEAQILSELAAVQGTKVEIGGYYHPDLRLMAEVMRPSATLNAIVARAGATPNA
ncbi:MAG: NADP-dependent isocitrate dehydrogenase [Rhodobacteraceae bacterium]|nr:NADP-dependent isocitrate dehydrogenase [Paracoccaceae bacterium]